MERSLKLISAPLPSLAQAFPAGFFLTSLLGLVVLEVVLEDSLRGGGGRALVGAGGGEEEEAATRGARSSMAEQPGGQASEHLMWQL